MVVQASARNTLYDYFVSVEVQANHLRIYHLRIGTIYPLNEKTCIDSGRSESFRSTIPSDTSVFNEYDVLYESPVRKLIPTESTQGSVLYTVTIRDVTFAIEISSARTFKGKMRKSIENLNIFAYVNSKFIYAERHNKT